MSLDAYTHHLEAAGAGRPLILALHGTGGSERQMLPFTRAVAPGAGILAPLGDTSEGPMRRFFVRRAEGDYDMEDLARATAKLGGFVRAQVAAIRPSRLIGLGYSNGANILASLMFAEPDLFDEAVLLHPLIPFTPEPAPVRARVLITAGARDPICPAPLTRALEGWFAAQGTPLESVWHPGGHEIAPVEEEATRRFLAPALTPSRAEV